MLRLACCVAALVLAACPDSTEPGDIDAPAAASTHDGIISIQDVTLANAPQLGHGMTVTALLTPATRVPDVDGLTGSPGGGCRAWRYVLDRDPPPPLTDQGALRITGTREPLPERCVFRGGGYECAIGAGTAGGASVTPGGSGAAVYRIPGAEFTAEDAGRYLDVRGAAPGNAGRFPIVAVPAADRVVLGNPAAAAEASFDATYTVIAGGGPVPNNPRDPIADDDTVTVGIDPGDTGALRFPDATLPAGDAFTPDAPTLELLRALPVDGRAVTLRCDACGAADATLALIRTTDAPIAGLSPFALPAPRREQVEIQCALFGGDGTLEVPAEAMALLAATHAASPITRVRAAYMRDGFVITGNPAPAAPNPVIVAVGHGIVGFTDVAP